MSEYIRKIYRTRYFWTHLVYAELKNKFRRSKLGFLWVFMNPLLLTLLMTTVFGTVFKTSFGDYAPYILSGIIVWNVISSSIIGGGNSILSGEQYIRQFNHPIVIYTLRSSLVITITFVIEMLSLVIWIIFLNPQNIILGIITFPLTVFLYFLVSWSTTTIAGFINAKYRDYPQVMALIIQALWYVSPVFFKTEMFTTNPVLKNFLNMNPVTHVLALIRNPFLLGVMPTPSDYGFTIGVVFILTIVACWITYKNQDKIIFYF
ncbi:ABC transporter permease [Paenibacillus sp. HWE-109]|uniref:ABC transporter permease n=1 Tax=Paenibacillus sp. HWE-109 TaxID=1306526 RepID=UPI001EDF3C31|nr:ABC transporter permease [Paenibacillus sp. HWE-109]UKS24984.1 ABC transporter permease [Paenibacillus sp. HWE-109]